MPTREKEDWYDPAWMGFTYRFLFCFSGTVGQLGVTVVYMVSLAQLGPFGSVNLVYLSSNEADILRLIVVSALVVLL